jgi:hypothetical protein
LLEFGEESCPHLPLAAITNAERQGRSSPSRIEDRFDQENISRAPAGLGDFSRLLSEGREACHGNNDPSDNRIENLRWGTREENLANFLTDTEKRASALEKVRKLTSEQAQEIRATDMTRFTLEEVAAKFEVSEQMISDILAGRKYREVGGKDLRMSRGFHCRGEKNGSAKLTDAQRRAIQATDFSKHPLAKKKALARQLGVSVTTIYNVLRASPDNKNYNAQKLTEQQKAEIRAAEAGKPRRGSVRRKEALAKAENTPVFSFFPFALGRSQYLGQMQGRIHQHSGFRMPESCLHFGPALSLSLAVKLSWLPIGC